jgi:hypothetical protein
MSSSLATFLLPLNSLYLCALLWLEGWLVCNFFHIPSWLAHSNDVAGALVSLWFAAWTLEGL